MLFEFPPLIQAGLDSDQYEVVRNAAGVPLGIARDKITKHFVGNAISILSDDGAAFNPVSAALQFTQLTQANQGFQAIQAGLQGIQTSLGVLQTMTALTGVGVAANLAVSAMSLWQILQLREDVKLQRLEMREGFLDLKQVLKDQGAEIIQAIGEAVQDIEFRQHRQALTQAYGRFLEASRLINLALSCKDLTIRNADLANARQILLEALADYKNPHILTDTDAVTQLRRSECVWAIEQTIAVTYQLQNQPEAVSRRLEELQDKVRQDVFAVIDKCESDDELDVIFPEITRIYEQDLAVLELWQNQVDWLRSLPSSERKLLEVAISQPEISDPPIVNLATPSEQVLYETLKQKSHFLALCDVLKLMMDAGTRKDYEAYISQQAEQAGHKALVAENLQQMSDLAVANLYWYFQIRDESEQDSEEEELQTA